MICVIRMSHTVWSLVTTRYYIILRKYKTKDSKRFCTFLFPFGMSCLYFSFSNWEIVPMIFLEYRETWPTHPQSESPANVTDRHICCIQCWLMNWENMFVEYGWHAKHNKIDFLFKNSHNIKSHEVLFKENDKNWSKNFLADEIIWTNG